MAAAEARAVWQRTANRCFVQEDAKRAPKLACCQSSSSSSKQADAGPTGPTEAPDQPAVGFMPLDRNPSYSNLPPDTRWWLQLQPNYGYQKGLTSEQLIALEAEMEASKNVLMKDVDDGDKSSGVSLDVHYRVSAVYAKKDPEVGKHDVEEALDCKAIQEFVELMDTRENYEFTDMDLIGCSMSKKVNDTCFDTECNWIEGGKTAPWWRATDKDDLASLVAQKSLDYMENCDLPPPQKIHVRKFPQSHSGVLGHDEVSTLDWKSRTVSIPIPIVHSQGSPGSRSEHRSQRASPAEGHMPYSSDGSHSCSTSYNGFSERQLAPESDPCKAQLLEALRHSQTRAREAETAAKQAYEEKEHILKLFFRQASQLFAYKQWFQLLQLEALYFQIKNNKDQPISTLFPVALPWTPSKGKKMPKSWQKATKSRRGKRGRLRCDVSRYAVAFALGLGLVGAGLLLGWTVGWMLPF